MGRYYFTSISNETTTCTIIYLSTVIKKNILVNTVFNLDYQKCQFSKENNIKNSGCISKIKEQYFLFKYYLTI